MPFPNCDIRTDSSNRLKLTLQYEIKPLLITELPANITHHGCCGPIKKLEYTFSYQEKNNPSNHGLFYTGSKCGDDFIFILHATKPASFSPFKSAPVASTGGTTGGGPANPLQLTALNKEVHNALNLLVVIYGRIDDAVKSLLELLNHSPTSDLSDGAVKYLNGVVKKRTGNTLTQAITAFRASHPNTRNFNFSQINACLARQQQPSNF